MGTSASELRLSSRGEDPCSATQARLPPSKRILVIADVRLHREMLADLLESRHVGRVCTAPPEDALRSVGQAAPDVAILDLRTELGLVLLAEFRAAASDLKTIVIGVSEDADVVAWAEAGVVGYVTTDESVDDLIATIASVVSGETFCSPSISGALLRRVQALASAGAAATLGTLTARETQVADLLLDGLSNKEIALSLSIALPTVKTHVHSILGKLNARRRGEAVAAIAASRSGRSRGNR